MGAIVWLIAAVVLAGIEMFAGELTFIMLAGGALAAAGISLADVPVAVEVLTFALSSIALLFFLKPILRRRMNTTPKLEHETKQLAGKQAVVVEPVSASGGMVRLDGSFWSARSLVDAEHFDEGDVVQVSHIDGTTAVVLKTI